MISSNFAINLDDPDIHDTPAGKALIGIVVGLGVFVVIVSVLLVRGILH